MHVYKMYMCMCTQCTYARAYTYTHTHMSINLYIHTHAYTYTYTCICICIHKYIYIPLSSPHKRPRFYALPKVTPLSHDVMEPDVNLCLLTPQLMPAPP